ncbi:MAG TPA: hypothetical protein VLM37_11295 [Fibrobacteraceae bacterium]|nr:hypothetical protein [Fibrobacteraceae bacterium]
MSKWIPNLFLCLALSTPLLALDYSEPEDTVAATGDEWEGFKYEDMGITQWEFQQVREAGISKDKLMNLLELGIRPSEYLQKPWENLGTTEEKWISERSKGMEDSDIDRSYRNQSGLQDLAYWSLLVPSLYQWKTDKTTIAISMDAIWAVSAGIFVYLWNNTPETNEEYYALLPLLAMHIWSFGDAFIDTRWENNPDANRFSMGVIPLPNGGWAGMIGLQF